MLDHHRITRSLAGAAVGHLVDFHRSLASTNDRAFKLGEGGHPHGVVVLADAQTAGRGRRGRSWESPPDLNLYLSVLLRPDDLPVALWPRLSTVVALALCRALEQEVPGIETQVKWPNDIYLGGRKVAGILIETGQVGGGEESRFAVVGTGINVHGRPEDFPPELRQTATSLAVEGDAILLGRKLEREAVAVAYLRHLACLLAETRDGFATILAEVASRSLLLGRDVHWVAEGGEQIGHALGLDAMGQLRVRLPDGGEKTLGSVEKIRPLG